jgi:hypothetical protein
LNQWAAQLQNKPVGSRSCSSKVSTTIKQKQYMLWSLQQLLTCMHSLAVVHVVPPAFSAVQMYSGSNDPSDTAAAYRCQHTQMEAKQPHKVGVKQNSTGEAVCKR